MKVVKGKGLGRKLGFPTINLGKQRFKSGVFVVKVEMEGKKYWGAMYVSEEGDTEIHLLNYKGNAYGKEVKVEVGEKIRETRKFNSLENLRDQIALDVDLVRQQLATCR